MVAKIVVFVAALAACSAVPVIIDDEYVPGVVMRIGRSPNMAFGFGSGFSSNIGGISHSTGMGASYQSGDAQAYGAGMGSNGNYASGVGMASAAPSYPVYQQAPAYGRNTFGSAVSSAQNYGGRGSAVSSANTQPLQYGTASSAVQNNQRYQSAQNMRGMGYDANSDFGSAVAASERGGNYGSAVAASERGGNYGSAVAASERGGNYGSAVAASERGGNYGSAMSAAQTHNGMGNFGSAVAAAQNNGGYRASTAQAMQQRGGAVQHSGASSINAPGLQAAQSHAVNNGFY